MSPIFNDTLNNKAPFWHHTELYKLNVIETTHFYK